MQMPATSRVAVLLTGCPWEHHAGLGCSVYERVESTRPLQLRQPTDTNRTEPVHIAARRFLGGFREPASWVGRSDDAPTARGLEHTPSGRQELIGIRSLFGPPLALKSP